MNNLIIPTAHTTAISIKEKEWKKLNSVFHSEKVWNFYVISKKIINDYMKLEIRSMRINEFCHILDSNSIIWTQTKDSGE